MRMLIFIFITWLLFSLMYSFNGRINDRIVQSPDDIESPLQAKIRKFYEVNKNDDGGSGDRRSDTDDSHNSRDRVQNVQNEQFVRPKKSRKDRPNEIANNMVSMGWWFQSIAIIISFFICRDQKKMTKVMILMNSNL